MESYELSKRHGETHFANIKYGYFVLAVAFFYLVFLAGLRKIVSGKPGGSSSSKWRKFLYQLYSMNPAIHLTIIWIPLLIPFYHHYSLIQNLTVYLKRLGRLSYVLLTLNLVLNLRPNWIFRKDYTYTDFIPLHKWLSRIIVLVATVHGILFLIYWALDDTRSTTAQILKYKNFIGLILVFMSLLLAVFSAGPMRRINYTLFYILHNVTLASLVLLTAIHARPGINFPYLYINITLLAWQAFAKAFYARRCDVLDKITDYKNTNIVNVHLPRSAVAETFEPGCHIRISRYSRLNPLFWLLPSHPYTVASLPSDSKVDLILSENKHPRSFKFQLGVEYTVSRSFAPAVPRTCLENAKRVCIVCGGSGISFGLPLYRHFKEQGSTQFLEIVWIVRNKYQLKALENLATPLSLEEDSGFHIYVTRNADSSDQDEQRAEPDLEFELESFSNEQLDANGALIKDDQNLFNSKFKPASINLGRRIDWAADLSHFVEHSLVDDTWLLACGPKSLVASAAQYAADNDIHFASEVYAL